MEKKKLFHLENIYAFIKFIVNWLWNLKNFSIIQVANKHIWNWLVNSFSDLFLPYKLNIFWLKCEKRWKVTNTF
jgi:hypothetical protein